MILGSTPLPISSKGRNVNIRSLLNAFRMLASMARNISLSLKIPNEGKLLPPEASSLVSGRSPRPEKKSQSAAASAAAPYVMQTTLQPGKPPNEYAAAKAARETRGILPTSPMAVKSLMTLPRRRLSVCSVR